LITISVGTIVFLGWWNLSLLWVAPVALVAEGIGFHLVAKRLSTPRLEDVEALSKQARYRAL
jgi:cytochrome c-type biogenesis protein CcmH/NrfF